MQQQAFSTDRRNAVKFGNVKLSAVLSKKCAATLLYRTVHHLVNCTPPYTGTTMIDTELEHMAISTVANTDISCDHNITKLNWAHSQNRERNLTRFNDM